MAVPSELIVPGWYSVASVKWLTEIEVVDRPFEAYFQTKRYMYEWERDGAVVREPVRLQRVRALITEPTEGTRRCKPVTLWYAGSPGLVRHQLRRCRRFH